MAITVSDVIGSVTFSDFYTGTITPSVDIPASTPESATHLWLVFLMQWECGGDTYSPTLTVSDDATPNPLYANLQPGGTGWFYSLDAANILTTNNTGSGASVYEGCGGEDEPPGSGNRFRFITAFVPYLVLSEIKTSNTITVGVETTGLPYAPQFAEIYCFYTQGVLADATGIAHDYIAAAQYLVTQGIVAFTGPGADVQPESQAWSGGDADIPPSTPFLGTFNLPSSNSIGSGAQTLLGLTAPTPSTVALVSNMDLSSDRNDPTDGPYTETFSPDGLPTILQTNYNVGVTSGMSLVTSYFDYTAPVTSPSWGGSWVFSIVTTGYVSASNYLGGATLLEPGPGPPYPGFTPRRPDLSNEIKLGSTTTARLSAGSPGSNPVLNNRLKLVAQ